MSKVLDVLNSPWAIQPAKLEEIQAIYATHLRGEKIDIAAIEARLGRPLANEARAYEVIDGVAVLSVEGVVAKRMSLFSSISGGVSTEFVQRELLRAMADPAVHSVIQYVDSPGGTVDGTQAYAAEVYGARSRKPIVTLASGVMASAGYWFGAAAGEVYIADSTTMAGSIGVIARHVDVSASEAKAGVKTTEIAAGKYKAAASQYAPLDDEGRKSIQDRVDYIYAIFVADIAQFRGVSVEKVLEDMAEGRVFIGQQAIDAGLVDGVSTLDALVAELNRRQSAGVAPSFRPRTSSTQGNSMNLDQLKAQHPDLVQALQAEGAAGERARIQAVQSALIPGHEKLIASLMFDGKTSGGDAALQVNAAERTIRETQGKANTQAAPPPVVQVPAPTVDATQAGKDATEAARFAGLPVAERCKAQWDANGDNVRAEFPDLATFTAYMRAEESGKAKRLTRKAA